MDKENIARLFREIVGAGNVYIDEPMKRHTSFKVGGPADILVTPNTMDHLGKILEICKKHSIPFFIMGNGTNLIVRDKGIRGVVIKILDRFNKWEVKGEIITAEAGILLSRLSTVALTHGLTGLEFASGIPGTLGGAVTMNAGAYDGEMKDVVMSTRYIDKQGVIKTVEGIQHQFGHRDSFIQREGGIVLSTRLQLKKGNREEIRAKMNELNRRRKDKQPLEMPSAGSVFRRPEGHYTGKLVEDCGLKGYRIGGAQVSEKHCGFIVNAGDASAEDIVTLIGAVQNNVKEKFGVELNTEVKIVGEE